MDDYLFLFEKIYPLVISIMLLVLGLFRSSQNPLFFISFWQLLCQRISDKVLPKEIESQQATISGSLALLSLLLPLLIILVIVFNFAEYRWAFDALILFVAADFAYVETSTSQSINALKKNKKQLAKEQLQKIVQRDTSNLSELGLIKTNIETYALRFSYQLVTVLFLYLLFGSIFALVYRLIYEASMTSNVKLKRYSNYSYLSSRVVLILQYLPVHLFSLLMALLSAVKSPNKSKTILRDKRVWSSGRSGMLLTLSVLTVRQLGGPVILEGRKIQRPRFGGKVEPTINDFFKTKQILLFYCIMFLLSCFTFTLLFSF